MGSLERGRNYICVSAAKTFETVSRPVLVLIMSDAIIIRIDMILTLKDYKETRYRQLGEKHRKAFSKMLSWFHWRLFG
jgi:hypothetical protein